MGINPSNITVTGDGTVQIRFTTWRVMNGDINVTLRSDRFGEVDLDVGPWSFENIRSAAPNRGVIADLRVERTADQEVLWSEGAQLTLCCDYAANEDAEILRVKLQPAE